MIKKVTFITIILSKIQAISAQNFDINLVKALNVDRNKSLDSFQIFISFTAEYFLWIAPIVILAVGVFKSKKLLRTKGLFILMSMATSSIFSLILKLVIHRPRPFETYLFIEKLSVGGSFSFPSGHTTTAFALALALALSFKNRYVAILAFLWAIAVGFSRIYCGVHYPSDVIGGLVLGLVCTYFCYRFYFKKSIKKHLNFEQNFD